MKVIFALEEGSFYHDAPIVVIWLSALHGLWGCLSFLEGRSSWKAAAIPYTQLGGILDWTRGRRPTEHAVRQVGITAGAGCQPGQPGGTGDRLLAEPGGSIEGIA